MWAPISPNRSWARAASSCRRKATTSACSEVCSEHGIIYVSDEVVTAFGRLGHFFASKDVFDFEPDIITSAKGLTSAYAPLSATLISDAFYDVISVPQSEGAMFTHGFTYSGHPVCCAAGLKNIEIMEREDICGHVREVGPYLEQQLATLSTCRSSATCAAATS